MDEDEDDSSINRFGNMIYFHADVTKPNILKLILLMNQATKELRCDSSETPCIHLFIHSDGGDAYAGISAMQHIQAMKVPVHTYVDGFVASAATFILVGGHKRSMGPHSRVLIHQLSTGFWGKYSELLEEVKNSKDMMKAIRSIYDSTTKMDRETIDGLLATETVLGSKLCLQYGIVHHVTDGAAIAHQDNAG